MKTTAQPENLVTSIDQSPVRKEETRNLSLYRRETNAIGTDGIYPVVEATFEALGESEKAEVFRLAKDLGFEKEQLTLALETSLRQTVIVLIFNKEKTKAIGTGMVFLMKEFGAANKNLGVSRLGTVGLGYAFIEEEFRGKHLGKELLRLRCEKIASGYFQDWVKQSSTEKLKLRGQKLDGKPVTKRTLISATARENIILYCDLRDKEAHFGRVAEAAEAVGMEVTTVSKENMQPYVSMTILQEKEFLLMYAFDGAPVDEVGGRSMLSRRNTIQPIYFYGPKKMREQVADKIAQRLVAVGAQYNETFRAYSNFSADLLWQIVTELVASSEYDKTLDQPNTATTKTKAAEAYANGKKLHMLTIQAYDTHRLSMGFSSKRKRGKRQ